MNYPNMSYCMCENTLQALQQVITAMNEEGPQFLHDMGREERQAFTALFSACEDFMIVAEELEADEENLDIDLDGGLSAINEQDYESDDGPLSDDQIEQVRQSVQG